jgi:dTDP-4-dehydrorhamnose reductase
VGNNTKITCMKTVLMSGGSGLLGQSVLKVNKDFRFLLPPSSEMDICNYKEVEDYVSKSKPDIFLHAAAFTRPMIRHNEDPSSSIRINISGTSNVTLACIRYNVKLVYISTDYVYPGTKGNYKENDDINPVNKYAISKLGGECAVRMYENALILRVAFSQRPFEHQRAFIDSYKSYLYCDEIAPLILEMLASEAKGIINIAGERRSVYDFASMSNPRVGKIKREEVGEWVPFDTSMNADRMNELLPGSKKE